MITLREIDSLKMQVCNYGDVGEVSFEGEANVREIKNCEFCDKKFLAKFVKTNKAIICDNCYNIRIKEIDSLVVSLKKFGLMRDDKLFD